jgi:predicted nucleotidyltransferase
MAVADLVPEQLLSQVVSVFDPRRVILVGSRARGDAREDSDYDLVVVLDEEVPDERLSARRRYEAHRGLAAPADIVPCRERVLKERARAIGSFAHTVLTEGVVVYERSR